jgi:hypothetical protein
MNRRDAYCYGYQYGRRLAADTSRDHERTLKIELKLIGNGRHRASVLGELRGYRDAISVEGHRVAPDDRWGIQR